MAKYTLCFGSVGCNDQAMENTVFRGSGCASSPVLKTVGPPKRVIAEDRMVLMLLLGASLRGVLLACIS